MRLTLIALLGSVLLLAGCLEERLIPDQNIPHRTCQPTTATILVRRSDGKLAETEVEVPAGWWIASPQVVE